MSIEKIFSSVMKLINLYIWIESTYLKIRISQGIS